MKGGWTYVFAAAVVYAGVTLKKITLQLQVKVRIQFLLIFCEDLLFTYNNNHIVMGKQVSEYVL